MAGIEEDYDTFEPTFTPIDTPNSDFASKASTLGSGDMGRQPFWKWSTIVLVAAFSATLYIINGMYNDRILEWKERADRYEDAYNSCINGKIMMNSIEANEIENIQRETKEEVKQILTTQNGYN